VLDRLIGAWLHSRAAQVSGRLVIAVDGKAVRSAKNKASSIRSTSGLAVKFRLHSLESCGIVYIGPAADPPDWTGCPVVPLYLVRKQQPEIKWPPGGSVHADVPSAIQSAL
jgi:hypothetical protein